MLPHPASELQKELQHKARCHFVEKVCGRRPRLDEPARRAVATLSVVSQVRGAKPIWRGVINGFQHAFGSIRPRIR